MNDGLKQKLQVWLFFAFLAIFSVTCVLTLLAVFSDLGSLTDAQKDKFINATLFEVAAGIIALFYSLFGLKKAKQDKPVGNTENNVSSDEISEPEEILLSEFCIKVGTLSEPEKVEILFPDLKGKAGELNHLLSLAYFFKNIGIVKIDKDNRLLPVSDVAGAFVSLLGVHIKEKVDFIGGWNEHGMENPKAQIPRTVLKSIESHRISEIGIEKASPVRNVKSSIILIKAQSEDGKDVYLTQKSNAWGSDYYWFVGGIREDSDSSDEDCAYRELSEELDLTRADINTLTHICSISDKRVSERLGILTGYTYEVFHAQLDANSEKVSSFCCLDPIIETHHGMAKLERVNKWKSWVDIENDPNMKAHAPTLVSGLHNRVGTLPYSFISKIAPDAPA